MIKLCERKILLFQRMNLVMIPKMILRKRKVKILESCATPNWSNGSVGQKESRSQVPDPQPQIPNPKSQILNPKSQILNPKSRIPNPESQIPNPKS